VGMANGNHPPGDQRSQLPATNCFPASLPWGCGEARAASGHYLPGGIPSRLPGHLAGLPSLPWWRGEAGITTSRHTLCHIPDGEQRRIAKPLSMITVQVQTKPASHAHLTSFGLSEARTSGAGPSRTHRGRSSREEDRTRWLIAEGIAVARG